MNQKLQCFMYHSELAPTAEISCVADIVKTARDFNTLHAITGVLIFDGQRFASYIEGALLHKSISGRASPNPAVAMPRPPSEDGPVL